MCFSTTTSQLMTAGRLSVDLGCYIVNGARPGQTVKEVKPW
jgi:hypothetical protein